MRIFISKFDKGIHFWVKNPNDAESFQSKGYYFLELWNFGLFCRRSL